MNIKVRDMIDSIDEEDLYKLKKDLSGGGVYLKKLVSDKIRDIENNKKKFCTTCGQSLTMQEHSYTLIFGPDDFRKKASFCEVDCLEYFLSKMKKKEVAK